LEVLLASLLMTLVLGTLWEVFHVYSRLFERGGVQARHARLVAALQRQFTDDLQSAIEDSPRPNDASAGSSVRRFGLQGSAHVLRFDVLETLPDDQLPASEDLSSLGRAPGSKPQVPELKTVVYRFVSRRRSPSDSAREDSPREDAAESRNGPSADASFLGPGLTRWEIDFETPLESSARAVPTKEPIGGASFEPPARGAAGGASFEDLVAQATAAEAATWLPEVRRATFRYFDGHTWSDSWNSLQRGSLPAAVEVSLRLRDPTEANHRRRPEEEPATAPQETEDSSEETSDGDEQATRSFDDGGLAAENRQPAYRFLVRLPMAQHRPELKVARASALGTEAVAEENLPLGPPLGAFNVVPAPALFPSPSSPTGPPADPSGAILPDQWLRTVP
jgi:hypothetical protein